MTQEHAQELLVALRETTRCLAWHEERHGVGMDRKAVEDARAAIAKAEGGPRPGQTLRAAASSPRLPRLSAKSKCATRCTPAASGFGR